jgi:PTH1 family peptidyl-tRNA hydrolase
MPEDAKNISAIRLIAGLGNPGVEYQFTRHNIGFLVADRLAGRLGAKWENAAKWGAQVAKVDAVLLVKPMTYMNRSGLPLRAVTQFYKIEPAEVLVVVDDFALPLGRLRVRPDGGPGGHNGLESVIVEMGTEEIPRLRVGIGSAPSQGTVDYVLGRFFEEEKPLVLSTVDRAADAAKCAIDNGLNSAMNTFNKAEEL